MPRPGFRECPYCAELIRERAIHCRHCHQWLPGVATPGVPEATRPLEQIAKFIPREVRELILEGLDVTTRAEWRVITIVFADLVGFTRLGETVDPESLKAMMERCFREMLTIVEQYGGTVMQFYGDATMAFFGAPAAHEDDPERAIRASLDMVEAIRRVGQELGQPLELSVGVNTGEVCVGYVNLETRADYTAFGDAVNLASRLEGLAGPGEIVVSERVAQLVAHHFHLRRLPPALVKNRREPVVPHLVLGPKPAARGEWVRQAGVADHRRVAFVGRRRELEVLQRAFADARRHRPRVVQVIGPPGIGKTRLIEEFVQRLAGSPPSLPESKWPGDGGARPRVHRCHALSYGRTTPYHGVIDLLRDMAGLDEGASAVAVRKRLGALAQELGLTSTDVVPPLAYLLAASAQDAEIVALSAKERKERIFAAVHALLRAAARRQPLILICDDIQWADDLSLEVFETFVRSLRRERILVIGAGRLDAEAAWPEDKVIGRLHLRELSHADSERLLREILGLTRLPRAVADEIQRKTEGNPFFVEEVVRQLQATGVLVHERGRWRLTRPLGEISVSDTLHGVIQARIDGLERTVCRVLQSAAVIGQTVRYRVLDQVTELRAELRKIVRELVQEEFIAEAHRIEELAYLFRNLLIQEVAYQSLLRRQRREVHRRVGEVIERLYPEVIERWYELLAHHFYHSDDGAKAAHYLAKAADKLERLYANRALLDTCHRLLEVLASRVPPSAENLRLAAETHIRLGRTHKLLGDTAAAVAAYSDAVAAAEAAQAPELVAQALRNVADVHRLRGEHDLAASELERAQRLWQALHMPEQALTCLNSRGVILRAQGQYAEATRCFQQAVRRAKAMGNLHAAANAMNNLGLSLTNQGQYGAALKTFREALAVMTELLDKKGQVSVLNNLGMVEERLGRFGRALDAYRQALALARQIDYAFVVAATLINIGQCHQCLGDHTRAVRAFQQVIDLSGGKPDGRGEGGPDLPPAAEATEGNPLALSLAQGNLVRSLLARGDRPAARRALAAALEAARRSRHYLPLMNATLAEAELHLACDAPAEALEAARRAAALAAEHGDEDQRGWALHLEGAALLALGEHAAARAALDRAREWARRTRNRRTEGWVLLRRAELLAAQGRGTLAATARRDAMAIAQGIGDQELVRALRRTAETAPGKRSRRARMR